MKDYVNFRVGSPTSDTKDFRPEISKTTVYTSAVAVLCIAAALFFGYQLRGLINSEQPDDITISSVTVPQKASFGNQKPQIPIESYSADNNGWAYESLLTNPVDEQEPTAEQLNIDSKLRCGTFRQVERAQKLTQRINSLNLGHLAVIKSVNDKFVVWIPDLGSRRLAEKLRHKVLDANIGRCVIYDA